MPSPRPPHWELIPTLVSSSFKPPASQSCHYAAATKTWSYVGNSDASNIPLGIDSARYEQSPVTTTPGDLVLCYTDGLIEARTADNQLLGAPGLLTLLQSLDATRPATFLPSLATAVTSLHPSNTAHDDITLLLLSPDPTSMPPSFFKRLIAPFRYVAFLLGLYRPA